MSDSMDDLITEATENADPIGDAASALLSPEKLEAMRNTKRPPPRARRPVEPETTDDAIDDGEPPPPMTVVKRDRWRKSDWQAHAERMEQEAEDARRLAEDAARAQAEAASSPDAVRDMQGMVAFIAMQGFAFAAAMRGPHWKIDQERADAIGNPGGTLLAMFSGDLPPWLFPAISFSSVMARTIGERVIEDKRIRALNAEPTENA